MTHGGLKIQTHVKYRDLNSKCLRMEVRGVMGKYLQIFNFKSFYRSLTIVMAPMA